MDLVSQPWGTKTYHLTMVILFKKDLNDYSEVTRLNANYKTKLGNDLKNKTGDFKN
jgi:hypothetical protein